LKVLTGAVPILMAVLPVTVFVGAIASKRNRQVLVPGPTSAGHHQIEDRCESCHSPFRGVDDQSCRGCHGAALAAQNDSHAAEKFLDPGRAEMLSQVDARSCLACHREHRPEARDRGSVSVGKEFCFPCHAGIGDERSSHRDLAPGSCADAGCHNYHDNRALRPELLSKEKDAVATRPEARLPTPSPLAPRGAPLTVEEADLVNQWDHPAAVPRGFPAWAQSSHALAGVNCSHCHAGTPAHARNGAAPGRWKVANQTCGECHAEEGTQFHAGRHGMRTAAGLSPVTPAMARLPMKPTVRDQPLDCNACHRAHDFDRQKAAFEACEGCHDDGHTRAYRASPHFALLEAERAGQLSAGAGVSCASCHLPRRTLKEAGGRTMAVHNQNDNLRPTDRMARDVCTHCHGLDFALDALASRTLIERNFAGQPTKRRTLTAGLPEPDQKGTAP
jgi:predicted CXXCH cytochrome family protein